MRLRYLPFRVCAFIALEILLSACKGGSGIGPSFGLPVANPPSAQAGIQGILPDGRHKIKHVIIVMQEDRSFNNLFYGYPDAETQSYGYDSKGEKIQLKQFPLETKWALQDNAQGFLLSCNGTGKVPGTDCRMNGFDKEYCSAVSGPCPKRKYLAYAYVPQSETKPYFSMAQQYVLADEMFASTFDAGDFISQLYSIAARAPQRAFGYPSGAWGCPGGPIDKILTINLGRKVDGAVVPCWDAPTLGGELDRKGLSWAFYGSPIENGKGVWSPYQAIRYIYHGPDWKKDVFSPQTRFFTDISNGKLRNVSWVKAANVNSDEPGSGSRTGPSWVASVVNAVGESKYWDSSAIFIFWGSYGGWYDPEPPAYVDYDGLGFRLPLLIISPYAEKGHVSHVHYEHGSIVKFVEDQFGLPRLAASDTRANSLGPDCFDFGQAPRRFVKISAPYDQAFFLHQPIDERPAAADQ